MVTNTWREAEVHELLPNLSRLVSVGIAELQA